MPYSVKLGKLQADIFETMTERTAAFIQSISEGYPESGAEIELGTAMLDTEVLKDLKVRIPLKTLNRHGLIAGATGTGKTKSIQVFAEQLSAKGIPSLVLDIKGDFSGIARPGTANPVILERQEKSGNAFTPKGFPVELLTISGEKGVKLRATVTEFGPLLLSKILMLNDTQTGVMSIVFKYADDNQLALTDLKDLKKLLTYLTTEEEGKEALKNSYGSISPASLGAIMRAIVALEQQGGESFFGEPSFDVEDLLQVKNGLGVVNILRVSDIQSQPQLFSTFMLSLFAEIYMTFPEIGDSGKPKLILFIDEAHLIFKEAGKILLNQIETMVKLIRSKGIGIYFITQIPGDIPEGVLSQLGLKVQHALRGFTAKDKKEINKAAENYPDTDFYQTGKDIQNLGTGEAFITALNEKGIPTPLVKTYMRTPESRMNVLTEQEIEEITQESALTEKYSKTLDSLSAYEILNQRMQAASQSAPAQTPKPTPARAPKEEPGALESVLNSKMGRTFTTTLAREGAKFVLGMLGLGNRRKR